jgi:hypothetical protein
MTDPAPWYNEPIVSPRDEPMPKEPPRDQVPTWMGPSWMNEPPVAPAQPVAPKETLRNVLTGPERYQLWPERFAREMFSTAQQVAAMPKQVYAGELDPRSEEVAKRAFDAAMLMGGGIRYAPGRGLTAAERAAVTSGEIGAPLPRAAITESPATQASLQASRFLPFVGRKIEERIAETAEQAGRRVEGVAGDLGRGDRAALGFNMRSAIDDVVEVNRTAINDAYSNVRSFIDPDRVLPAANTAKVYQEILAKRTAARQPEPGAGLEQIKNIVEQGVSFNGLIRAKSDLASKVDFLSAQAGFSNADRKLLGAAMKRDLHEITAGATLPGHLPVQAQLQLRNAESQAGRLINFNERLSQLTAGTGEELASTLLRAGRERGGDLQVLAQLRNALPREQFNQIAGSTIAELGTKPSTGMFDLNTFASNWARMSQGGKAVMFEPQHRRFLDDIANMGRQIETANKYLSSVRTGIGPAVTAGAVPGAALALGAGTLFPALVLGGTVASGYMMAAAMARPQTAAALARVARTAEAFGRSPNAATRAALGAAENATMHLLAEQPGMAPMRSSTGEQPLPYNPNFL